MIIVSNQRNYVSCGLSVMFLIFLDLHGREDNVDFFI